MKIGILSETHGHVDRTTLAFSTLMDENVDIIIHCGDIGSENVLTEMYSWYLSKSKPIYAVLGNVDYPDDVYSSWNKPGEIELLGRFGELSLDNKSIAIIHGDNSMKLQTAIFSNVYDYVLTGHTHVKDDRQEGTTRIINPGAVYRASQPTVACLDLNDETVEFLPILGI